MKVSKKIALLAASVFWFAAAPIAVAADDAATIRANTEAWFKAFNAGNATPSLRPTPPTLSSWRRARHLRAAQRPSNNCWPRKSAGAKSGGVSLAQGKMNDLAVKGDMAWHAGTYSVIKDGTTVDTGAYMEVLRKKGGKWLIVRDMWNSSTPPPTAPPPPAPAPAAAPKK